MDTAHVPFALIFPCALYDLVVLANSGKIPGPPCKKLAAFLLDGFEGLGRIKPFFALKHLSYSSIYGRQVPMNSLSVMKLTLSGSTVKLLSVRLLGFGNAERRATVQRLGRGDKLNRALLNLTE